MKPEFYFIGWCCETDSKGSKHDKIWASFKLGENYYCCWGARGKTVNFKKHPRRGALDDVERSKRKKYDPVNESKLLNIWPDFYDSVDQRLFFCTLADKIR